MRLSTTFPAQKLLDTMYSDTPELRKGNSLGAGGGGAVGGGAGEASGHGTGLVGEPLFFCGLFLFFIEQGSPFIDPSV